ncbi:MAG: DUF3291 domain-containing protein [Terracidiphilus sp.]
MMFVSLTRLRIRSFRFLPQFLFHMVCTLRQVRKANGFQRGMLLADRHRAFWTLTGWSDETSMREYMSAGAHKTVMPRLLNWCDEASVAHWTQSEQELPSWDEADRRMRESGRPSKVRNPSPSHAALTYTPPRSTASARIRRA